MQAKRRLSQPFQARVSDSLPGDKIRLSPLILDELLQDYAVLSGGSLPHPLVFSLQRGAQQTKAYGVVLEFTAEADVVEIGPFVARNLGIAPDDGSSLLSLAVVELEKALFATLVPLTNNYLAVRDMRSLLESHLRHRYSTIAQGSVLEVDFGRNQVVKFMIKALQPAPVCLCLDTDLEVDIQPDNVQLAQEAVQNKLALQQASLNWSQKEEFLYEFDCGLVRKTETQIYKVPVVSEPRCNEYRLELDVQQGDCNVFISDTNESPSLLDHCFFDVEKGSRDFCFSLAPAARQDHPFIYVAVEPYHCESAVYSIKLLAMPSDRDQQASEPGPSGAAAETQECTNCHLFVPARSFQMHTAFCVRNNVACPRCQKVFLKPDFPSHWHCDHCDKAGSVSEKEKHESLLHSLQQCSCGESLYVKQVAQHKRVDCPDRFIVCRFCHLLLRAGPLSRSAKDLILGMGLTEHESVCGSRTIVCVKCSKSIQLKDISIHAKTHELQKQSQGLPLEMCKNVICGTPLNPQFPNVLKLCQNCFKPFYSPRYDPTNQRIPQKLVQTYHHQLTVGCGTEYCVNQPNDAAVEAIALLQQSALMKPQAPYYSLCVQDQTSARRHVMAKQLQEISENRHHREWCIKALLECKEDGDRALAWLRSNAPVK
ncbi:hypothetical protein HDU91_003149 [Kappamyces sp. JEL0680]|nr:hypothetical protein HDU91_003149 [Kappamyces sp. JEL0680]